MCNQLKIHSTISSCGIDCGLCPRYYTTGTSACPGCGVVNFAERRPLCGVFTCCAVKHGLEVCSQCSEYPCKRFVTGKCDFDSFVSHKRKSANLEYIKTHGIESFLKTQSIRIEILQNLLVNHNDGRTKSFFCLSCALLPIEQLQQVNGYANKLNRSLDVKSRCKTVKEKLMAIADDLGIELRLVTKG